MIEVGRRQLITGIVSLIAAPAIVRVANIMPIRIMVMETTWKEPHTAGLFTCPYCGGLRGGMCPICWRNAIMPGLMELKWPPYPIPNSSA